MQRRKTGSKRIWGFAIYRHAIGLFGHVCISSEWKRSETDHRQANGTDRIWAEPLQENIVIHFLCPKEFRWRAQAENLYSPAGDPKSVAAVFISEASTPLEYGSIPESQYILICFVVAGKGQY